MKLSRKLTISFFLFTLSACLTQQSLQTPNFTPHPTETSIPKKYYFAPHTADEAQSILSKAEEAILEDIDLDMPLSQYSLLYRAAFYAAWNAHLYFPEDPRAKMWEWKMAYYSAMGGDSNFASHIYSQKITKALNEDKIPIDKLPSWFQSGEVHSEYKTPHFELEIQPVNTSSKEGTYLIQLGVQGGIDIPGAMCLLIANNKNQAETFLVYDGFAESGFFPTLRNPSYCTLEDATGDGIDEIITHNWYGGHVGTSTLQIIDLSTLPPKALLFGAEKKNQVSAWNGLTEKFENQNGKIQIPVREKLGQCDIYLSRHFEWNGNWFESVDVSLSLLEGGITALKDCYYYIPYYSDKFTASEAAQILDEAIKVYSPGSESEKDILEELRVKKALIYLFAGNPDKALDVFQEIANKPIKEDGIWVEPTKKFLQIYQKPSDLYRACVALTAHDLNRPVLIDNPNNITHAVINLCHSQALEYELSKVSLLQSLESFTLNLRADGVEIASEGWLDLDQDGIDELWFMTEPPTQLYYQLWLVSNYPNSIKIFNGGEYPSPKFEPSIKQISANRFLVEVGQPRKLIWIRDQTTNEPLLTSLNEWQDPNDITDYSAITEDLKHFREKQEQFHMNDNFEASYEAFIEIANRYDTCPFLLFPPAGDFYKYECGNYYYAIGFSAELAGDNKFAQKMYAKVIGEYPDNPLALLAREKISP